MISKYSLELQADFVVVMEKLFGVHKVDRILITPQTSVGITIPELNVNVDIPAWYGSDWSFLDDQKTSCAKAGMLFIVCFGQFYLEGTALQIKNCWIYTRLMEERMKQETGGEN